LPGIQQGSEKRRRQQGHAQAGRRRVGDQLEDRVIDPDEAQTIRHGPLGPGKPLAPVGMRQEIEIGQVLRRSERPRTQQCRRYHRGDIDRRQGVFLQAIPAASSRSDGDIECGWVPYVRRNVEFDGTAARRTIGG
jgi:hypothetical protein